MVELAAFARYHLAQAVIKNHHRDGSCEKLVKGGSVNKEIYHNPDRPYQGRQQTPMMSAVPLCSKMQTSAAENPSFNEKSTKSSSSILFELANVFWHFLVNLRWALCSPKLVTKSNHTRCSFM